MNEEREIVSLVDLIDRLVEVAEPEPISLLPQTWAWVAVAAILLAALAYAVWRGIVRHRHNAYRRAALAELDAAGDDAAGIAEILRRAALAAYPRADVAGLAGEQWLAFLDAHANARRFSEGPGRALASAPYAGPAQVPGLNALAREWVRRHERSKNVRHARGQGTQPRQS